MGEVSTEEMEVTRGRRKVGGDESVFIGKERCDKKVKLR